MNNKNMPQIISQLFFQTNCTVAQCDACSPVLLTNLRPSQSIVFPHYAVVPQLIKQQINSTFSVVLSSVAQAFSVVNVEAMRYLQQTHPFQADHQNAKILAQMVSLGLLVPEGYVVPTMIETPDKLSAWLHLSEQCNLHCSYCYLPRTNADMSPGTGKTAIAATVHSAVAQNYKEVKFKYAGGEPLLRFPLVKELHQYAKQLAERHQLNLDGVVISNGTLLTSAMVKDMQALGLRLTISLDHLQHGVQRVYPDGRNSAPDAMRGIEIALDGGLRPDISITVSGQNVRQLPEVLDWVLARGLPFSLNFYRPHKEQLDTGNLRLDEDRFVEGMLAAYKMIESNLPERSLLASLVDMANFAAPHLRRCSVGHSYLVFDTEGRVSKCQMQMDKPVADLHTADPLAAVRADSCGIQNVTVDEKEGCQDCQWKYWCAGGCPLETYRTTGRYDVKSPNCNIYKALYPEVIRLEGLRLLKYADKGDV